MENTNNKPLSVVIYEAKKNIINAINDTKLHPTLLEMILKEIYTEVSYNAESFAKKEIEEYNSSVKNEV